MKIGWIYKDSEVIELPSLTAVIQKEEGWYVSPCPELGVASQDKTRKEAHAMLAEAVELWLEAASAKEIRRLAQPGVLKAERGDQLPRRRCPAHVGSSPFRLY